MGIHVYYYQSSNAYGSVAAYTTQLDGSDKSIVVSTTPFKIDLGNRHLFVGQSTNPSAFGLPTIQGMPIKITVRVLVNQGTSEQPVWHELKQ
ncbi:uncharacterized protein CTRU02_215574 [Colletotrichum truncatum]|uniref:Uncharacterized protein n=1 Tax=Colletotrichum truncatum TaxID=5467 RepID=A0ACC3YC25_COLTU|nr:uncharacterized protein CTRU02_05493 [Colletotrichum truncatum]KAF6793936.1 hypothetical protein CTRU02_05493 [Colletotrichum truncatum]